MKFIPLSNDDITNEEVTAAEAAKLSEAAFARDWDRPEEDEAWQKLDQALLKPAEGLFDFWDNPDDAIYDQL